MLALIAALSSALLACEDDVECPAIAYLHSLQLSLISETWQDGRYLVTVASAEATCELTLARSDGSFAVSSGVGCGGTVWSYQELAEGNTLTFTNYQRAPSISVVVERDGVLLHDDEHTLSYRTTSYPHGRECGGPQEAELNITL